MRAIVLDSVPATPVVAEVETPRPEAGELLVKVAASSVNGFDAATTAGRLQGMMEHRFPLVIGKDFAGTVEALGEGVAGFVVGDPVFGVIMKPFLGTGSLAQYVTVSAAYGVAPIPDGLSVQDAGALGLAGTAALDAVNAVAPVEGETVLVSGATGGVGALAVQIVAARGAKVIATARPGAEADFVTALTGSAPTGTEPTGTEPTGSALTGTERTGTEVHLVDFTGDLDAQVRRITPDGVDAVLHLAGDAAQLAALLRPGGRIASTLGFGPDAATDQGFTAQDLTAHAVMADTSTQTLSALAADAATGALRVPVTATYPLEQAPAAFAAFGAGALGKLAVTCS